MFNLNDFLSDLPKDRNQAIEFYSKKLLSLYNRINNRQLDMDKLEVISINKITNKLCLFWNLNFVQDIDKSLDSHKSFIEFHNFIEQNKASIFEQDIDSKVDDALENYLGLEKAVAEKLSLSTDEKEKIRERLVIIRTIIQEAKLSEAKREALLDKIQELEKEVDYDRTKSERFFGFMEHAMVNAISLSDKAKTVAENIVDICKILVGARARQEKVALPKPDDIPQLNHFLE